MLESIHTSNDGISLFESLVQLWQLQWSNRGLSRVKNIVLSSQADDINLKILLSPHTLGSYILDGHTFSPVNMTKGAVLITDHGLVIMSGT